jgi:hypothetical protein
MICMAVKNRLYPEHRVIIFLRNFITPHSTHDHDVNETHVGWDTRTATTTTRKDGQWRSYATSSRSGKQAVPSLCATSATFSTDGTHSAPQLPEMWLIGQLKYCCRYNAACQTAYPKIYRAREGWLHVVCLSVSVSVCVSLSYLLLFT